MTIVDEFPFPIHEPMAIKLVETLADLYDPSDAIVLARSHGIKSTSLQQDLSPIDLWVELLERFARTGKVRIVVTAARDQFSGNKIVVNFLNELLAEETAHPPSARERQVTIAEPVAEVPPRKDAVPIKDGASLVWVVWAIVPFIILVGAVVLRLSNIDGWLILAAIAALMAFLALFRFFKCSVVFSRERIGTDLDNSAPAMQARTTAFIGVLVTIFSIAASGLILHSIGH